MKASLTFERQKEASMALSRRIIPGGHNAFWGSKHTHTHTHPLKISSGKCVYNIQNFM